MLRFEQVSLKSSDKKRFHSLDRKVETLSHALGFGDKSAVDIRRILW